MTCYGLDRAFMHPDVVIGWYAYTVVAPDGTDIRTNTHGRGSLIWHSRKGATIGVQSVRNPTSSPTPPRRPAFDGYVWCYSVMGSHTGWVKLSDLAPLSHAASPLDGPGGYDFEVGLTLPRPKKPNGCGKLSLFRPKRRVAAKNVYLRYSGRGTAFHFLHEGDIVRKLISNGPGGYAFVEVVKTAEPGGPVFSGYRGWVGQEHLASV